jgi:hypothetical protein
MRAPVEPSACPIATEPPFTVDRVVFATGYRADVTRVPYLRGVIDQLGHSDGFPELDEAFGTTRPACT